MPAFCRKASVALLVVSHMFCRADWTPLTEFRFADVPVLLAEVTALRSALPMAEGPSLRKLYASVWKSPHLVAIV